MSHERSITIEADGRFVNLASIVNGEQLSDDAVTELFRQGKIQPLNGFFDTVESAVAAAGERSRSFDPPEPIFTPQVDFDIQSARDSGFTDTQIADFLAEGNDFDIAGARETGFDDAQISNFLVTGQPPEDVSAGAAVGGGATRSLSTVLGAPVDLATGALNIGAGLLEKGAGSLGFDLDIGRIERPLGGSERIREDIEGVTGGPAFENFNALSSANRAFARAGESVGASGPFAVTPLALARTGIRTAGAFAPILNAARNSPKAFALAETGGVLGAAGGAGFAELLDPGDVGTSLFAEISGGFLNPIGLAGRVVGGTKNSFLRLVGTLRKTGREKRAAEIVQSILEETGENPAEVARLLSAATVRSGRLTAGQKSGSPALLALERKLARSNAKFSNFFDEGEASALSSLRKAINNLAASGDPAALRVAAKLRGQYFDELFDQQIALAEKAALDARAAIRNKPGDLASVSERAAGALDEALKTARNVETSLWDKIPKRVDAGTENLAGALASVKSRLLKEEKGILGVVGQAARRLTNPKRKKPVKVAELLKVRSRALALSREARSKKDFTLSGALNDVAQGALDDLMQVTDESATIAREFSARLNDKFTRSFGGDALATAATGGRRISPEVMLERAFSGGGTQGAQRFRELRAAGEFADVPSALFPEGSGFGGVIRNEQETFLRIAARKTIDPKTGRVNPDRLGQFVSENAGILDEFPLLKSQLSSAQTAEVAFREVETAVSSSRVAIQKEAFSVVLGTEAPSRAVGRVLTGANPQSEFRALAKLAKGGGDAAVGGLRAATIEHAVNVAGRDGFSLSKFRAALTKPLSRGQPSVLDMMKKQGIIKGDHAKRLDRILAEAETVEASGKLARNLDNVIEDPSALFDLVVRIAGANVGGAGAIGQVTGTPIVAAQAGSRFARRLFEKVPAARISTVLIEASENPKFMAALLEKPKTLKRAAVLERQINAFLIGAGIIGAEDQLQITR